MRQVFTSPRTYGETHSITEKITSLVYKTYTFEEFGDITSARGWTGEFGAYEF